MGKFFDDKFNKNKQPCNCPSCRGVRPMDDEIDAEAMTIDVEIPDPQEIVAEYFAMISQADSPEEVFEILNGLFYEGVEFGAKEELLDDIQLKIEMLNALQNGN